MGGGEIAEGDRVTFAEAQEITGRSHAFLSKRARLGVLSRMGGQRSDVYSTFLSRSECEALAVAAYRRGQASSYWMTLTQVSVLAKVSRANVHLDRKKGRLPARRTAMGDFLVTAQDAYAYAMTVKTKGPYLES